MSLGSRILETSPRCREFLHSDSRVPSKDPEIGRRFRKDSSKPHLTLAAEHHNPSVCMHHNPSVCILPSMLDAIGI